MSTKKMTPAEVIENRLSSLLGEVLTVVEAVVPAVDADVANSYSGGTSYTQAPIRENTQRSAVKSLIRSQFSRAQTDMQNWIK